MRKHKARTTIRELAGADLGDDLLRQIGGGLPPIGGGMPLGDKPLRNGTTDTTYPTSIGNPGQPVNATDKEYD